MSESRAALGVLLAGVALIASLFMWSTDAVTGVGGLLIPAMVGGAVLLLVGFSGRRHGKITASWSLGLSTVGGLGLLFGGLGILLVDTTVLPRNIVVAVSVIGAVSVGIAAADYRSLSQQQLLQGLQYLLYATAFGLFGLVLAGGFGELSGLFIGRSESISNYVATQIGMLVGFLIAVIGFITLTGRGIDYLDVRIPDRRGIGYAVGGIVGIVFAAIAMQLILLELGVEFAEHSTTDTFQEEGIMFLVVAIIFAFVTNGIGEELLFRNGLQKYLTEWFTPAIAILVNSIIFAGIHIPAYLASNVGATLGSLLVVFVLSIVLGGIYHRTQNVIIPAIIHGSYNGFLWIVVFV